ncbi:flagellar export chaperone FliS [Microbacterium sp. PMB16]|uniref:flagellar export chaperone FliS n=1 Tax=Microbacterium sp. PMB16 TaxID=3120157 RepID=UPI003F4B47DF
MPLTSLERAKQQYLQEQVASASPERLLTMLYDRLLVDVDRAAAAQEAADWTVAGNHLSHAQQIVAELSGSLTDAWDGAADLRGVYTYLTGRLIAANISRDLAATAECRDLIAPLRDAWHQAAAETSAMSPAPSSALA